MTKIDDLAFDQLPIAPAASRAAAPRPPSLRDQAHPRCVACAPQLPHGLRLDFRAVGDGSVRATFDCAARFEGYPGCVHGGIIATVLDSAMTNCLFAQGHQAVTAELSVKYKAKVLLDCLAVAEARVTKDLFPLFVLEASLAQEGQVRALATAKFIVTDAL